MKTLRTATLAATLVFAATTTHATDESALRRHVAYLASAELEGRAPGTRGEELAAAYIADQLRDFGVEPLSGRKDFLIPFEFSAGARDAGSSLTITTPKGAKSWSADGTNIVALTFADSGEVSGEVVFAGYGIRTPERSATPYDSFAGIDVKDKIVVVLRYFPEKTEGEFRQTLSQYSPLRFKAMHARELGAKGLIVVTGPASPNAGEVVPMTSDTAVSGSGVIGASVSGEVAGHLFDAAGKSLADAQAALDTGNPHATGFKLDGVTASLKVAIERERKTGFNVVGWLPPNERDQHTSETLVIGAHYDHLGRGGGGNSLARTGESGQIHFGADDNASGVAAVLEAARVLSTKQRPRGIVFGFWSAEEMGLVGANAFIKTPPIPLGNVIANLNLDMVGRMKDNRLTVQGTGSSNAWGSILEGSNVVAGFDLNLMADPYVPTDAAAFYEAGIPILHLFTGTHEDYHRPTDTADKINYPDLARVSEFAVLLAERTARVSERPLYERVERKMMPTGGRGMRAYTGTIPDYTTEVTGLKLQGVIDGGPAAKAGLKPGDIIIQLGAKKITNIYDYTYALDDLKVGVETDVVVMRGAEKLDLKITPSARK